MAGLGQILDNFRPRSVCTVGYGIDAKKNQRENSLVPRTRSSHHNCRESECELRVQSGTRIIELLVSFDSEVRYGACGKLKRTSESGHWCGGSEVRIILAASPRCGLLNQSHTRFNKLPVPFDSEVRIGRAARLGELQNRDTRPCTHKPIVVMRKQCPLAPISTGVVR